MFGKKENKIFMRERNSCHANSGHPHPQSVTYLLNGPLSHLATDQIRCLFSSIWLGAMKIFGLAFFLFIIKLSDGRGICRNYKPGSSASEPGVCVPSVRSMRRSWTSERPPFTSLNNSFWAIRSALSILVVRPIKGIASTAALNEPETWQMFIEFCAHKLRTFAVV